MGRRESLPENRVWKGRYTAEPREIPEALAGELAVLHSLPQVMRIIRTANSMLSHPVERGSPKDDALRMRRLIYEAWNTLAMLRAGTVEKPLTAPGQAETSSEA